MFGFTRAIVWPIPVTVPCAARPADPSPLRHLEIETFSIARVGHNIVCHGGKHAIAQRLADRRTRAMVAPWSLGDVGTPAHARTP